MSSEPVKIEVDCPVAPHYTHLHHHHHHHHHHHVPHHHHHHHTMHDHLKHATHIGEDDFVDEEDEEEDNVYHHVSEKIDNKDTLDRINVVVESEEEEDHKSNDSGSDGISNNSSNLSEQSKSITNGSDSSSNATTDSDSSSSISPRSGSPVSNGPEEEEEEEEEFDDDEEDDSEQVGDDDQDDDGDNDDGEDDDDDEFEDDDDEDEDDEGESENDCDDIVDPVGTHYHYNIQQQRQRKPIGSNNQTILGSCNGTASAFDRLSDESDSNEDDISFDGNCDGNTLANNNDSAQSPDILDGERMLEVTRKLVRSTERDPDRDLRKQVLLKTAIRKLPHFMDYNRYNDNFEQNFQLHSNNNNTTVNCLSTSQYYEHHHIHLNNHIDAQPKPYYHSVQPNAIQMSTTSLRKLDLNDDLEPETNNIEIENHLSYNNNNNDDCRTSLDSHQQNDYSNSHQPSHNLYDSYNQPENLIQTQTHSHSLLNQHDHNLTHQPRAIHDFNSYSQQGTGTCQSSILGRHTTLDNLYQPLNGSCDIDEEVKTATDRTTIAFQVACDSCDFSGCANDCTEKKLLGNLDATSATNHIISNGTNDELSPHNNHYHIQQNHQMTTANAFCASTGTVSTPVRMPMKELETNTSNYHNLTAANSMIEGSSIVNDNEGHSEGTEGGLSESSTTSSNDSANSIISSQLNESTDEHNCSSILETSLNTSSDFYQSSHDSGVILFSPRSNKRSSSSIGLDDEMDIDHSSTDLCTSTQLSSTVGTNVNQYKKLRKRDIID